MRISGPGDTSGQQRRVTFDDKTQVREYDTETGEVHDYEYTSHSSEERSSFLSRMRTGISNGLQRIREVVGNWLESLTAYVTRRGENPGARVSEYLNSDNDDLESMSSDSSDGSLHLKPKVYIDENGKEVDADTYFGRFDVLEGEDENEYIDVTKQSSHDKVSSWLDRSSPFSSSSSSSSEESIYATPRRPGGGEESIYATPRRPGGGEEPIYATPRRPGGGEEPIYEVTAYPTQQPGGGPPPSSSSKVRTPGTPPAPPPKPSTERAVENSGTGTPSTQGSQKNES